MHTHRTLAVRAALLCLLAAATNAAAAAAAAPHGSNPDPAVIFTHKWTSSKDANELPPAWLTVPALLDIQPMLLQVDVRRDVAAQLRRFCHAHGIDVAKYRVLLDALNEFVDFNRLCSPQKAKQDEPSFLITKNLIVRAPGYDSERQTKSTFTWMQDDAQSIAADLCRFAQTGGDIKSRVRVNEPCVLAVEAALLRSLNWINSLESCDLTTKHEAGASHDPQQSERELPDLTNRIAAVEQSIAALKTTSEQQPDRNEQQNSADATELPEGAPLTVRDVPLSTEDTLIEARAEAADAASHPSSSTDQGVEINIRASDNSEEDAASLQEVGSERDIIEEVEPSPPDASVDVPSFGEEDDADVVSSTNEETELVAERDDTQTEERTVDSLPEGSVAEDSNVNPEPSSPSGRDGNGDRCAAEDLERDLIEADNPMMPEKPTLEEREMLTDGERPPPNGEPVTTAGESTLPALGDLPANAPESSSSAEETSTPVNEAKGRDERMRSPIAVEAIGMLSRPDEETSTPSPELLEVLSTLAMLLFVFYLVFDLLSIAISNFVETLRTHGGQAAQALFPFLSRSERKIPTARESEVAPLPEYNDSDKESLSLASPSTPRAWANLIFAASSPREQRRPTPSASYKRHVEAIEKVAKLYMRRLQRAAFSFWRGGTMPIGPNVALIRRESSEEMSTAVSTTSSESVQLQPSNPTTSLPARTSFTCVAMALMLTRHGAIFHATDKVGDDESSTATKMKTTPELSQALAQMFEGRRDCAARRIQQIWRSKHKKRGVKLSITTDSNLDSFHPQTTAAASTPSTPLFALLTKDLRKRQATPKAPVTAQLKFAARRVMTPASSARLPPAS
ncbi:hypothetical protein Gpo141_00003007 [Globisporangium polare]